MKLLIMTTLAAGILGCLSKDIKLPEPDMNQKSATVVEALAKRHSVREFSDRKLTTQELSNLCWAACGVSRNENFRTAPTAMNSKEIRLYVFTDENVYEYLPTENRLRHCAKGDQRMLIAGSGKGFVQDFVLKAPVSLVMVIDFDKFTVKGDNALMMGCVDAGNVSENINLFCQSVGMATVPRATMDVEEIRKLLGLSDQQLPVMNNPVGFPAE